MNALLLYTWLFLLGIALGSFVNALVWRLREQQKTHSKEKLRELSIFRGRSMCPSCSQTLSALELVPLFSWIFQRGRCRHCKKPISVQYPLVELATGLMAVASYLVWPFDVQGAEVALFAIWLLVLTLLVALVVYDLRWMELPDKVVYPLIGLTALFSVYASFVRADNVWQAIGLAVAAAALLFALFYGIFTVSNGTWIGGGDVKLMPVLGLLAGTPLKALLVIFLASLIGTIISIPLLLHKKSARHLKLPFGPLLILALVIVFFWGQGLIDWYDATFLTL